MIIKKFKSPFEHIIVDDVYEEKELCLLWRELDFLSPKLAGPLETNSATDSEGVPLKNAGGLFLDNIYADRNVSDILRLTRRTFCKEILDAAEDLHPFYGCLKITNKDSTLLNYYGDGCGYRTHADFSVFTAVTIFCKNVNYISGGELFFTDYNFGVENKNNRLILFPGCIKHEVKTVKVLDKTDFNGRYSVTQFMLLENSK